MGGIMNPEVIELLPYAKRLFYPQIAPQTILEIAPDGTQVKDVLADNGRTYYEIPSPYDESFMGYADVIACFNIAEQDWDVCVERIKQSMFPMSILIATLPAHIDIRKYFQTFSLFMTFLSDGTAFTAVVIGKDDV
jgi:hypothetical protein